MFFICSLRIIRGDRAKENTLFFEDEDDDEDEKERRSSGGGGVERTSLRGFPVWHRAEQAIHHPKRGSARARVVLVRYHG
jgi:hypothetical protein